MRGCFWSLLLVLAASAGSAYAAAVRTVDGDFVTLENEFLRAKINAAKGGRLESLVLVKTLTEIAGPGSIVEEVVPLTNKHLSLADEPMRVMATTEEKEAVVCALERMLPDAPPDPGGPERPGLAEGVYYYPEAKFGGLRLEKRYVLPEGEARLRILYRVTNTARETTTVCLAFSDTLGGRRTGGNVFVAGPEGAMKFPEKIAKDEFARYPYFSAQKPWFAFEQLSGGWIAAVTGSGIGGLRLFDPRALTHLKLYVNGTRQKEALTTDVTLKPGEAWEVETTVLPVTGMTEIHGATSTLVVGISLEPLAATQKPTSDLELARTLAAQKGAAPAEGTPTEDVLPPRQRVTARVTLHSAVSQSLQVAAYVRRGYRGTARQIGTTQTITCATSVPQSISVGFTLEQEGTWYLTAEVQHDEKPILRAERAAVVGNPSGIVCAPLVTDRIGTPHRTTLRSFPPPVTYRPELDEPSPHVPFARPYAQGPIKVLFLYPYFGARDVVELAQRLDLDYEFASIGCEAATRGKKLGEPPADPDEVINTKRLLAQSYDVIVAAYRWEYWPWDVRAEILSRIRDEGTGLVLVNPGSLDDTLAPLRKNAKPSGREFPGRTTLSTIYGKGRIAFLGQNPRHIEGPQMGQDCASLEPVARAIVWAARKEPKVAMRLVLPAGEVYNTRPTSRLAIELSSAAAFEGNLTLTFRQALDQQYRLIYTADHNQVAVPWWEERARLERAVSLEPGTTRREEFDLPPVPAAPYRLHVNLTDTTGKVAAWLMEPLTVQSDVSVEEVWLGKPGKEAVRCDYKTSAFPRIGYFPSERLEARVTMQAARSQEAIFCRLRLEDPHGRVICDEKKPATGQVTFSIPLAHALHKALIAIFEAHVGNRPLAETRVFIPMREYPERRHLFRFTQMDNEGWVPFEKLEFAQYTNGAGINPRFIQCAMRNFEFHPSGQDVIDAGKWEGTTRVPCFNNPEFRQKIIDKYRKLLPFYDMFGKLELPLIHEWQYGTRGLNNCHCPHCQEAFRKYVQRIYPNLRALNAAWHSNYADWSQVTLPELDAKKCPPEGSGEWARALDAIRFTADHVAEWGQEVARLVKELTVDGEAGSWALNKMTIKEGMDFWAMAQWGKYAILYRDLEEWQSFIGPGGVRLWRGYGRDYNPSEQSVSPWLSLLRDEPGSGDFTCNWYPMCLPDGRRFPGPEEYFRNYRIIRHGPERLLLGRGAKDGVAIHWSSPSFFVYQMERWRYNTEHGKSALDQGGGAMDWPRRIAHFYQGTGGLGLDVHYVSHGHLAAGSLGLWGKPKIIFLPYSVAMEPAEAKTLEEFVRGGGVLVGGVNPATRDRHGLPYPKPLLDHVFGVERGPYQGPVLSTSHDDPNTRVTLEVGIPEKLSFHTLVVAPANVTPTTAKPLAYYTVNGRRAPAFLVNHFGRGKAILLNFEPLHFNEYTGEAIDKKPSNDLTPEAAEKLTTETTAGFRAVVRHCIELAGVRHWAQLSTDGKPLGASMGRFVDGQNTYVGLVAPWGYPPSWYAARRTELGLPARFHVYEMLTGTYVGFVDKVIVPFDVHRLVNFYACLPYRVAGIETRVDKAELGVGEVVTFSTEVRTEGAPPGRHVLRVDVLNPTGELVPLYCYNLEAPDGKGRGQIFLALNDPPGKWRIMLRDVATGTKSEAGFTLVRKTQAK